MCQSKSQGGRRCNGTSRRAGGGISGTRTATMQAERPAGKPGVPSREDADRLAAALAANRVGWDKVTPLNEKDRRLYALRESGYKGPIDQDGYPDTTSKNADVHRYLAESRGEKVSW